MIAPLDQQLIGRYVEVLQAHKDMPTNTAPVCESMTETAVAMAMDGQLTHIMYIKDDKLYVGRVNEFHSMVPIDAPAKQPKAQRSGADTLDKSGGSVGEVPESLPTPKGEAANTPLSICFDAALLHTVIKNTPGENIACKVGERMVVFESGDVTTALALVDPKMYP